MNALVAGKGKLKLLLCGHACGRRMNGGSKAYQPKREQRRNFAPALFWRHALWWDLVDFMHRVAVLLVQLA